MVSQKNSSKAQKLEAIVGKEGICLAEDIEPAQKQRISRAIAPGTDLECIVYPQTVEQLAAVVAKASSDRWPLLTCGSGSKLDWGGLVQGTKIMVSCDRLNGLIEHAVADLTVTVEAGMKFTQLQQILAKTGQFLGIDPAYPENATIGGIVATADTGSLRQRYRGLRDMLLGISFVRADGKIAKGGGRVVKNVAGYDLMKLLTGSYGTLGIITQVTIRTYPLPEASATVVLSGVADDIAKATQTLLSSALTPVALDLISPQLLEKLELGKGMGLIVRFQNIAESVKEQSTRLLEVGEKLGLQSSFISNDADLWQRLKQQIWGEVQESEILCKIGVIPTEAATTLNKLESQTGLIHAGSGIGILRFDSANIGMLLEKRRWCESRSGFLSVLVAPSEMKQNLDVWGYSGNALDLMRKIKQKFDPQNLLNFHRFVDGI